MEKIYNKYKTDIFRYALSFVKNTHTAEDITQETFLAFFEVRESVKNSKAWLLATAKNKALNILKQTKTENIDNVEIQEKDTYNFEFFDIISVLEETDREIITLYIVIGLKHREIAKLLNLTADNVRKRYQRALETLRLNLGDVYNE